MDGRSRARARAGPSDELSNLAAIGFVEHLLAGDEEDVLEALDGRLGSATRAAIAEFRRDQLRRDELRKTFGSCRCKEVAEVVGEATAFHKEHLVWIDARAPGLDVYRCPGTGAYWSSSDRRAGAPVRMR